MLNELHGNELKVKNFIMEIMDGINTEADNASLMKVWLDYLKTFISTFEPNEINPFLTYIQKNYDINNRPIDIAATKKKNEDSYVIGNRVATSIELPKWPSGLKNPYLQQSLFGKTTSSGKNSKKRISCISNSKLEAKINNFSTIEDTIYLFEYFSNFYFDLEKVDYLLYDKFLDKFKKCNPSPKKKEDCFKTKTKIDIFDDMVSLFIGEDLTIKENNDFFKSCIKRYKELYL